MRGLCGIAYQPGMRRVPRPGRAGGSRGGLFVPGLRGRRRRCGEGPGGTAAGCCRGRGLESLVPSALTVRVLSGQLVLSRCSCPPRPAAGTLQAPPQGAGCGVQPHGIAGAYRRPCRRPAGSGGGAPSRGAGKAAASSRLALPIRRAGVVSTSVAGTDDAGNATSCAVKVHVLWDNGGLTGHFSAGRRVATRPPEDGSRQGVDPTPGRCPTGTPGVSPQRENGFHIRPFQHL